MQQDIDTLAFRYDFAPTMFLFEGAGLFVGVPKRLNADLVEGIFRREARAFFREHHIRTSWEVFLPARHESRYELVDYKIPGFPRPYFISKNIDYYTPRMRCEFSMYCEAHGRTEAFEICEAVIGRFHGEVELTYKEVKPVNFWGRDDDEPRYWIPRNGDASEPMLKRLSE